MANVNGGYVIVDLGLSSSSELYSAISTGTFEANKKQFDDLKNANLSGKPIYITLPYNDVAIPIACAPFWSFDDDNVIDSYGVITTPMEIPDGTAVLNILVRQSTDDPTVYNGEVYAATIGGE